MANRDTDLVHTPKSDVHILTAKIVGGGAAGNPTLPEATQYGGGEIATCIYAGSTGTYTGTFRKKYPQLLSIVEPGILGVTAGIKIRFTAIDFAAGTFAFTAEVGAVATDLATTTTVYFTFIVRNSGRN